MQSVDEAMAANVDTWSPCEVLGDHVMEFVEAFDYVALEWDGDSELKETDGGNTGGVKQCYQRAIWAEDPETESGNLQGDIMFGLASANLEGDGYADAEFQTPRGRYDEQLALRREYVNGNDNEAIADTPIEGPWDEAVFLSYDAIELTVNAFVLDIEHDFMLSLSVGLGRTSAWDSLGGQMTWALEEAKTHFLEVTVPNAYQAMLDQLEAGTEAAGG